MKNIVTRSISGIVYIAVIVAAISCGPLTMNFLCLLLLVLGLNEFLQLTCGHPENQYLLAIRIIDLLTAACIFLPFAELLTPQITPVGFFAGCLAIMGVITRILLTIYDKNERVIRRLAYFVLGLAYILIPMIALAFLGNIPLFNDQLYIFASSTYSARLPLIMFVMIWLNDTGAYCVGSMLGRHRLFERLSPKKSWEGFWGGMAFSILGGVVFSAFFDPQHRYLVWAIFGVVISVAATYGDLFESLIKRTLGVKDSGKLIPGHGGILDRIDSLLFAAPAAFIIAFIII